MRNQNALPGAVALSDLPGCISSVGSCTRLPVRPMDVSWSPAVVGACAVTTALYCASKHGHHSHRDGGGRTKSLAAVLAPLLENTGDATVDATENCTRIFYGPIIHSRSLSELQVMQRCKHVRAEVAVNVAYHLGSITTPPHAPLRLPGSPDDDSRGV